MTAITTNGHTYSDDGSEALDMGNGGHRTHLLPMLGDVLTDVATVSASAAAASASATAAQNYAAALQSTSTSSLAIATGSKTFATQAGKQFAAGQWVTATSAANSANQMFGQVTSYSGSTLIVDVQLIGGSGTHADWNISVSGARGASQSGAAAVSRSARTSNTILGAANIGALIDVTSGTFTQTFEAAATLGNGWWCYYRNGGTGDITIPSSDGLTNWIMYPGEARLFQCDGSAFRSIVLSAFNKTFSSSTTLIVPPGYAAIGHRIASGSGGGGSGRRGGAGTTFWGGSGGGGAGRHDGVTLAPTAGGSVTVTIGAAGTGGAAQTVNSTNGSDGTEGGSSSLAGSGFSITVAGGGGGKAGTTSNASDVTGGGTGSAVSTGGTTITTADYGGGGCDSYVGNGQGGNGSASLWGGGGGGCGIGYSSGTPQASTSGGTSTYGNSGGSGGSAGAAGAAGASAAFLPGGGGGGGGAALNGTNSGAGGAGVAGWITVWGII